MAGGRLNPGTSVDQLKNVGVNIAWPSQEELTIGDLDGRIILFRNPGFCRNPPKLGKVCKMLVQKPSGTPGTSL
jgi:hypothetical protein